MSGSLSFGTVPVNSAADQDGDSHVFGHLRPNRELRFDLRHRLQHCCGKPASHPEPWTVDFVDGQFKPTTTGTYQRQLTINSDSTTGSTSCGSAVAPARLQRSTTHVEPGQSRVWQRYGEHGDNQDCDADVLGHLRPDRELGFDHRCRLQHHFWKLCRQR